MERVAVIGCSGAGKTTVAASLATKLDLTHIELDEIHHQPRWVPRPEDEFRAELDARMEAADGRWVTCGNYTSLGGGLQMARADTIVWLDLAKALVMRRVISRTVRRAITREELWNGNREPMTNFYRWDPEVNVMRWAWVKHADHRERYGQMSTDGSWAHADVHRLRSPAEVDELLEALSAII